MSGEDGEVADVCASCGIAEIDEIKLNACAACKSLRYCSIECQKNIVLNINEHVKNGWLSCVTKFCLDSLKAEISATVPSAVCRSQLI